MLHFKGISFLTAYLAIPVSTLFLSNKEITVRETHKVGGGETRVKRSVKSGEFSNLCMKRNLQNDETEKEDFGSGKTLPLHY